MAREPLNTLQGTGQRPQQGVILPKMSTLPRLRNPAIATWLDLMEKVALE